MITGPSSNRKYASPKDVKLPNNGSIDIRRAENGLVVTIYDNDVKYDDPGHCRTIVAASLADLNLVK
jgi:hypothetical protein